MRWERGGLNDCLFLLLSNKWGREKQNNKKIKLYLLGKAKIPTVGGVRRVFG